MRENQQMLISTAYFNDAIEHVGVVKCEKSKTMVI